MKRWVMWMAIMYACVEGSTTHYVGHAILATTTALTPFAFVVAMFALGMEPFSWHAILAAFLWYLAVGLGVYFSLPVNHHGAWHERGAW